MVSEIAGPTWFIRYSLSTDQFSYRAALEVFEEKESHQHVVIKANFEGQCLGSAILFI